MDLSSMRPSSWNGVGAMAKVPAALGVSFVICASILLLRHSGARASANRGAQLRTWESRDSGLDASHRPGMTCISKPSRAHLDLFLGEKNLACVLDDILRLPALMRRLPARLFHHPHFAHAARTGNPEHLAGLVARQFAHHV